MITVVRATLTLSSIVRCPAVLNPQITRVETAAPMVPPITFVVGAPVSCDAIKSSSAILLERICAGACELHRLGLCLPAPQIDRCKISRLGREATLVSGNGAKVRPTRKIFCDTKKKAPTFGRMWRGQGRGRPGAQLMREVYLQYKEWLISQIRGGFISAKEMSALISGSV